MDTPRTKNRLLLVDGDPKSLRVLDVSLKKAGFEVTTATSGTEALSSLEAELPDLIISDTDLEEMDGFELCNRVKANPEWAKIPFLFVSGRKSIEDKIRGLELGVDDYLTKPIYIKEIGIRVRTALQRAERERMESRREGRTRFAGSLTDVGVVDLVQTIELNRKSGIIHIVNRDDRRGSIFFRDGKVIDAEVGRLSGAHALYRLFSWSEGQFAVEFKNIRRHDVVDMSMAALLMEGMRRLDESTHLLENLPPPSHVLEVDCRVLAEELAELPDEMNSVLRLCDGARTLVEVIEESDHPDLETLSLISKLFLGQIIFAREAPGQGGETQAGVRLAHWLSEGGAEPTSNLQATDTSLPSPAPGAASDEKRSAATSAPVPLPVRTELSAEETLGAAFPLLAEPTEGGAGASSAAADTLKGVPLDALFLDRPDPIEVASGGAPRHPDPVPMAVAGQPSSTTRPMGLAERLLSADSVLRTAAMHEAISDGDGRVQEAQSPDRNTHSYGDPTAQAAAALVQEVVSSTHATTTHAPAPVEPGRPTKEVDWGAWPTLTAPLPSPSAPTDSAPTSTAVAPPALAPTFPSKTSSAELEAADIQDVEPADLPQLSFALKAARDEVDRPLGDSTSEKPEQPPIRLQPEDVLPAEQDEPAVNALPLNPPTESRPPEHSASPPTSIAVRVSSPTSDNARPSSKLSSSRPLTSQRFGETQEPSHPWRLWLMVLGAFALGMTGYLAVVRKASPPDSPVSYPSADPVPTSSPVTTPPPSMVPPSVPPSPVPEPDPKPQPAQGSARPQAPIPPSTEKSPSHAEPARSAIPDTQAPSAVSDVRQRCLDTDAGGKGKAKPVVVACRPALEANPKDAEVMVILARAEIERGRLVEARSLARKALAADAERYEAYVYLGTAEQAAGRIDEARAAYKKYLELAPDGPFARELRAIISNL